MVDRAGSCSLPTSTGSRYCVGRLPYSPSRPPPWSTTNSSTTANRQTRNATTTPESPSHFVNANPFPPAHSSDRFRRRDRSTRSYHGRVEVGSIRHHAHTHATHHSTKYLEKPCFSFH